MGLTISPVKSIYTIGEVVELRYDAKFSLSATAAIFVDYDLLAKDEGWTEASVCRNFKVTKESHSICAGWSRKKSSFSPSDLCDRSSLTINAKNPNSAPTISGVDTDLGEKNVAFGVSYNINDGDTSDSLTIIERLNGVPIQTKNNAPTNTNFTINITKEMLNTLKLNSKNTIVVSVTDGKATSYRNFYFTKTNVPPTISANTTNLGTFNQTPPSIVFDVNDAEGDSNMSIKVKLDNIDIENMKNVTNGNKTYTIPMNLWLKTPNGNHVVKVIIEDSIGGANSLDFTFIKLETIIQSDGLTNIIPTDALAKKIMLIALMEGETNIDLANSYINVCNNAYDANPAWENALTQVLTGEPYLFKNKTKVNQKAGINLKFKLVKKANVSSGIQMFGLGGAFE